MQPLLSPIDHEARANHRAMAHGSSEHSPLLQYRIPRENDHADVATIFVVGCLLFVLLSGAIIGIYLLVLQIRTENLLPPVDAPRYIRRSDWNKSGSVNNYASTVIPLSDCVVILQTDTGFCEDIPTCAKLIEEMEYEMPNHTLPYNYIITNEGDAYEYLGSQPSNYVPNRLSFVFAFIGNYTHIPPKRRQILATKSIINELVINDHLVKNYTILGKNMQDMKYLIKESPSDIIVEVDKLMLVFFTRMYSNFTEAASHINNNKYALWKLVLCTFLNDFALKAINTSESSPDSFFWILPSPGEHHFFRGAEKNPDLKKFPDYFNMQPPNSRIAKKLFLDYEKSKDPQYLETNGLQTMMDDTGYENMLRCTQAFNMMQIRRDENQLRPYNFMISSNRPMGVFGGYTGNISRI